MLWKASIPEDSNGWFEAVSLARKFVSALPNTSMAQFSKSLLFQSNIFRKHRRRFLLGYFVHHFPSKEYLSSALFRRRRCGFEYPLIDLPNYSSTTFHFPIVTCSGLVLFQKEIFRDNKPQNRSCLFWLQIRFGWAL